MKYSILLLFFISSCFFPRKISSKRIVGNYHMENSYDFNSSLSLKGNKTFEYSWVTGMLRGTTNGNWKIIQDTLILNSEKQPTGIENEEVEYRFFSKEKLLIKGRRLYDLGIPGDSVFKKYYKKE